MTNATTTQLHALYEGMARHYGPTHWWPGDTPFEIAIGAILTQNTAWTNVEKAIGRLKLAKLLRPHALLDAPLEEVEDAVRPSGYYRQKAKRIRIFAEHLLQHHRGSMARMARQPLERLRPELLSLHGIGPETADDILLYACEKPVFVVDAYTRRVLSRHGLVSAEAKYEELRAFLEERLTTDLHYFQEYHGLIVWTGKDFCRTRPQCEGCPLQALLGKGQPL